MKKEDWIKVGAFVGIATVAGIVGHYWLKKQERSSSESQELFERIGRINKTPEVNVKPSISMSDTKVKREEAIEKNHSKFPIQLGDQGDHIMQVQANLLKHHGWAKVIMGIYDKETQNRVKRFWKVDQITKDVYQKHIKKPVKLK